MYFKEAQFQNIAYICWLIAAGLLLIWAVKLWRARPKNVPFVPSTGEGVHTSVMNIGKTSHILEVKGDVATHSTVVDGNIQRQHVTKDGDTKFTEP